MKIGRRLLTSLVVLPLMFGSAACGGSSSRTMESGSGAGSVDVTMADYSFSVSGKLTQGEQIHLKNSGSEIHMMGLGRLKPGATLAQVKEAMAKADPNSQDDPLKQLVSAQLNWPGGMVGPGHDATVSAANLTPGSYVLICFLPQEGTGKPHYKLGMVNKLDVVAGTAKKVKKADASYIAAEGKPITGPSTLKAGVRTIELTGTGNFSKLQPQLVRAASATQTPSQINDLFTKDFAAFGSASGPSKGSGKRLGAYLQYFGFDMDQNKTITITVDFKPGTYYLVAPPDTGNDNDNTVPKELIKISVS